MTGKGDDRPVAVDTETKGRTLTKARFTFEPDKVLEVGDAELLDARRGGYLYSYDHGNSPVEPGLHPWEGGDATLVESGIVSTPGPAEQAPNTPPTDANAPADSAPKKGDSK